MLVKQIKLASIVNLYNKRARPRKIQEQNKKIHSSNILGGNFLEAIFLRNFLNIIFWVKSHLHESSLTEKERKKREKKRDKREREERERERKEREREKRDREK